MGQPYPETQLVILNGGFVNADHWTLAVPWTIAGGLLIANQAPGASNPAYQEDLAFLLGNLYKITFTLLNPNWINPDGGLVVQAGGGFTAPIRLANTYTVTLESTAVSDQLQFFLNNPQNGDYCEIDNVSVTTPCDYPIEDQEIVLPNNLMFEIHEGVATEFFARYSSLNGKSNILMAWNEP